MKKTKSTKMFTLLIITVALLTGCQLNNNEPLVNDNITESHVISEEETVEANDDAVIESDELPEFKFNPPNYTHERGDEFLQFINSFSGEDPFPEFDSVESIDFYPFSVSTALYHLVLGNENEIEMLGMGVSDEIKEEGYRYLDGEIVSYDAINHVGKQYFGENFNVPYGTEGFEVKPIPTNKIYLGRHSGRGGRGQVEYYLIDVNHSSDTYIVTFLPYYPEISWDDQTVVDVSFPNLDLDYTRIGAKINYPENITTDDKFNFDYMNNLYLTTEQENLSTITVTFKEDNGKLIAISSTYNIDIT